MTAAVRGRPGAAWRVAAAAMAQYDKKIYMQLKLMPTASTGPQEELKIRGGGAVSYVVVRIGSPVEMGVK